MFLPNEFEQPLQIKSILKAKIVITRTSQRTLVNVSVLQDRDELEYLYLSQSEQGDPRCQTSLMKLPINFKVLQASLEKNTFKLISTTSQLLTYKFQTKQDRIRQMIELNLNIKPLSNSLGMGEPILSPLQSFENLTLDHFKTLFKDVSHLIGRSKLF